MCYNEIVRTFDCGFKVQAAVFTWVFFLYTYHDSQSTICLCNTCICAVPYTNNNCINLYKWPILSECSIFFTRKNHAQIIFTSPAATERRELILILGPLLDDSKLLQLILPHHGHYDHHQCVHINSERRKLFILQFSCSAYIAAYMLSC